MITFSLRKLFIISYPTPTNNWHSCIIIIHKRHETFSRKRATKNAKQGKGEKQIAIIYTQLSRHNSSFPFIFYMCVAKHIFSTLVFPKKESFFPVSSWCSLFLFLLLFINIILCTTHYAVILLPYNNNICTRIGC